MISIYDGSVLTYTELMDNVEKASSLSLVPARPEPIFFKPAFAFAIERDIKKTQKKHPFDQTGYLTSTSSQFSMIPCRLSMFCKL